MAENTSNIAQHAVYLHEYNSDTDNNKIMLSITFIAYTKCAHSTKQDNYVK